MPSLRIWLMAARPRTLPAAVAPVLVGTALASTRGSIDWIAFLARRRPDYQRFKRLP